MKSEKTNLWAYFGKTQETKGETYFLDISVIAFNNKSIDELNNFPGILSLLMN